MRSELKKAGISTHSLGAAQKQTASKIKSVTNSLNQQQGALKQATRLQGRHRRASQKYHRAMQRQANVSFVGAAGFAVGGAALRGMASIMSPSMGLNTQMSAVGAIAGIEKTSEEFKQLRNLASELGSTTQFTSTQAAQGMRFLAMTGFEAKEILASMPSVLDLAKAGDTELATTADIASNIMSAFGLEASQMGMVADTLASVTTGANVDLLQLGDTMKYVAAISNEVGSNLQETAAMAGLLGNIGVQGSQAGTSMRAIYTRLASPPRKAANALQELALTTTDAAGNLRAVPEILAEVARKTEKMGNAKRLGYFKKIAGDEAGTALAKLVREGGTGEITKFAEALKKSQGEAARIAAAMADNLEGDVTSLSSAWAGFQQALGDTQDSKLRSLTQGMTDIVRIATQWVKENPKLAGTLYTIVGVLASLWAVAGGLALAVAGLLGPFAMASFALTTIGLKAISLGTIFAGLGKAFLLNPIGLTITAIALAGYLIWKYWEPLTGLFNRIFTGLKTDFWGTLGEITSFLINWSPLGLFYKAFAGVLSWFGVELPDTLTEFGGKFIGGFVGGLLAGLINWSPLGLFYKAFAGVLNWFGVELPNTFTGFGAMIVDGLIDGFVSYFPKIAETLANMGGMIKDTFKSILGIHSPSRVFADLGGNITQGLTLGLQGGQGKPLKALNTMARSMVAPIAMSAAMVPAYAGQAAAAPSSAPTEHIEIHIHAGGTSTAQEIAAAVRRELDARDQDRAQAQRSQLYDPE